MDGEQTESFTSFGEALDAAAAKREQGASPHTSSDGENGSQSASHTPTEGTSSTSVGKSGTSNPANGDTASQGTSSKTANQGGENRGSDNYRAASRRHRQRETNTRVNARVEQLTKDRDELLRTGDEQSILLAHQKNSEIENLLALQADAAYQEWADRASEAFEDADVFLEQSERFGDYVNKHEPELQQYIDRPYGLHLYRSWMDQMENGNFRTKWVGLTQFEKGAVLNRIYQQIVGFANGKGVQAPAQAGQAAPSGQTPVQQTQQSQQPPVNIPIAGSGRETNIIPSPDSFSEALNNAAARRGHKPL